MSKNKIKDIFKKLLFDSELTPTALSRQVNLPQQTIQRITTGKCNKPHKNKALKNVGANSINVYSYEQLSTFEDDEKNVAAQQQLLVSANYAAGTFGVLMNDSSMTPYFPKNSILILEAKQNIADRDFGLVRLANSNTYLFRQVLSDREHYFLKALNADLLSFPVRKLNKDDHIIGILVETRQVYNKHLGVIRFNIL